MEGQLVAGCLSQYSTFAARPIGPILSARYSILETSEMKPSPATVDSALMDYENMGVLRQISGLLFARPYGYSNNERLLLHEVIRERTRKFGFPVIADMDFGHTSPMLTLPIGCNAVIDSDKRSFAIAEASVL